jgi:hypothetical protein
VADQEIAVRHAFADEPWKIGLLTSVDLQRHTPDPPVIIASLLELTEETVVLGTRQPDDILRTTFDRFMGIAVDDGKLKTNVIPACELARIERFAAKGVYRQPPPPPGKQLGPSGAATEPSKPSALDVDDMMG